MTTALAAVVAFVVALAAVPPTIRLAVARNLVDAPDECRRIHLRAVPRLGGIAVWLGLLAGFATFALLGGLRPLLTDGAMPLAGVLAGIVVMLVVGLVDDLMGLSPAQKLLGQLGAAALAIAGGFRIEHVILASGLELSLGGLSIPATALWLVAVTNAFNLIDGLDGLASAVALVALATVAVSATILGASLPFALALLMAGALLGFLLHNRSPARIFLGDVGSLSIGFSLAYLTVEGARDANGAVYLAAPILALAFPLLDTMVSMLRRWLRGVPLSSADGRHVHHQLIALGLTHSRATAVIALFAAGVAALGLSISFAPPALTLMLAVLGTAVLLLVAVHGARFLQYHELIEAQASVASGFRQARGVIRDRIQARDLEFRLRRSTCLAEVEGLLEQYSAVFHFERMALCRSTDVTPAFTTRLNGTRLMRLDRPVFHLPTCGDTLVLRVWWHEDSRTPPLYGERIVRMIAPAVEHALSTIAGSVEEAFDGKLPSAVPEPVLVSPARARRPAQARA